VTRTLLVLQHAPWERPGLITRVLAETAPMLPVRTATVLDERRPDLPAARDLAGLVVMGGPMNADDDARHPGLATERRLLADAVDADVPVLAVCLGMQLLARALGAVVHPGAGTEIGFAPVDVLADDPVLAPLGSRPAVLHWHSDAADLPTGATLLASTPTTPVQAFRAGSALGLQFHLEMDAHLLEEWLTAPPMVADLARHGVVDLADQAAIALPALAPRAVVGLTAFAEAVRAGT
jgi:GMP synthase (glutamine-hydrolysing)